MFSDAVSFSWEGSGVIRHGPAAGLAAVGDRQLVDEAVRRGRVDVAGGDVGDRAGRRDLRAARPGRDAGRREAPELAAAVRVDRERDPVGRRDEDRVVRGAADRRVVHVDRGVVSCSREGDGAKLQVPDVRGGDPRREVGRIRALRVQAELGPVEQRRRDRGGPAGPGAGGERRAERERSRAQQSDRHTAAPGHARRVAAGDGRPRRLLDGWSADGRRASARAQGRTRRRGGYAGASALPAR